MTDLPVSSVPTIRTYVSRLRAVLGDSLASRGAGYALAAAPEQIDARKFESLLRDAVAADSADPDEAVTLLDAALSLWRGAAYAEHADVPSIAPEARRLDMLRNGAAEARTLTLLHAGRYNESVSAAEALVTAEPLFEGGWTSLIEGLAAQGRTADALRAFQRAAAALADAGLEPSHALPRGRAVRARGRAGAAESPTGAAGSSARPPRVGPPTLTSSFIGRENESETLAGMLEATRVVTLVGTGGVEKTRLASKPRTSWRLAVRSDAARRARRDPRGGRRRRRSCCRARPGRRGRARDRETWSRRARSTSSSSSTMPSTCSTPRLTWSPVQSAAATHSVCSQPADSASASTGSM